MKAIEKMRSKKQEQAENQTPQATQPNKAKNGNRNQNQAQNGPQIYEQDPLQTQVNPDNVNKPVFKNQGENTCPYYDDDASNNPRNEEFF